jgi:hypothetical protein
MSQMTRKTRRPEINRLDGTRLASSPIASRSIAATTDEPTPPARG